MKIDCYGFKETSVDYFKRKLSAVDVATSGTYTYIRYSKEDSGPIHRIEENASGITYIRWAYGAWDNRASLTYTADLNSPIKIND